MESNIDKCLVNCHPSSPLSLTTDKGQTVFMEVSLKRCLSVCPLPLAVVWSNRFLLVKEPSVKVDRFVTTLNDSVSEKLTGQMLSGGRSFVYA